MLANFLAQHKELIKQKGHRITIETLEELRRNAIDSNKQPVYIIEYGGKRWFLVEEHIFNLLNASVSQIQE